MEGAGSARLTKWAFYFKLWASFTIGYGLFFMPTSEQIAASGTEDALQSALLNELAITIRPTFPQIDLIYHIPNGGSRGSNQREAQINGARMKALGVKRGVPDLCLPIPMQGYGSLYIEMKKPKDGALSVDQKPRIKMLTEMGNMCAIIDDWRVGVQLVYDYLYVRDAGQFRAKYAITEIGPSLLVFDPNCYYR